MSIEVLRALFSRDLIKLKKEIESYQNEANLWRVDKEIINSGGNLSLHLVGNLNAFIGAALGNSGYIRERELEFSLKNVARSTLIAQIEECIRTVDQTLSALESEALEEEYPILVFKEKKTTGYFLAHLTTHLSYHLGQVNYHRRLLDH